MAVCYEIVRRWANHFGSTIAADLRKAPREAPYDTTSGRVYLKIGGRMAYWAGRGPRGRGIIRLLTCGRRACAMSRRSKTHAARISQAGSSADPGSSKPSLRQA